MSLFKVKGSTTKSFGTMRHSATRIICTSSEPNAGRRCPQRFPRKIASATFQLRQTLKRLPLEPLIINHACAGKLKLEILLESCSACSSREAAAAADC